MLPFSILKELNMFDFFNQPALDVIANPYVYISFGVLAWYLLIAAPVFKFLSNRLFDEKEPIYLELLNLMLYGFVFSPIIIPVGSIVVLVIFLFNPAAVKNFNFKRNA